MTNEEIFIDINDNKAYDLKTVYELLKLKHNYQGFESYSEVSSFIDKLVYDHAWDRYDCEVPVSFNRYCELYIFLFPLLSTACIKLPSTFVTVYLIPAILNVIFLLTLKLFSFNVCLNSLIVVIV